MKKITVNKLRAKIILDVVSEITGVPIDDIKSSSRELEIVKARHICSELISKETTLSLKTIGSIVNRSYCSVLHSKKIIDDLCFSDKTFKIDYDNIRNKVIESFAEKGYTTTDELLFIIQEKEKELIKLKKSYEKLTEF